MIGAQTPADPAADAAAAAAPAAAMMVDANAAVTIGGLIGQALQQAMQPLMQQLQQRDRPSTKMVDSKMFTKMANFSKGGGSWKKFSKRLKSLAELCYPQYGGLILDLLEKASPKATFYNTVLPNGAAYIHDPRTRTTMGSSTTRTRSATRTTCSSGCPTCPVSLSMTITTRYPFSTQT